MSVIPATNEKKSLLSVEKGMTPNLEEKLIEDHRQMSIFNNVPSILQVYLQAEWNPLKGLFLSFTCPFPSKQKAFLFDQMNH